MKKLGCLFVLAWCSVAMPSGFFTGAEMAAKAQAYDRVVAGRAAGDDSVDSLVFRMYIAGVHDAMDRYGATCVPDGTASTQLAAVVSKRFREQPEQWGYRPDTIIYLALDRAFPCPAKK